MHEINGGVDGINLMQLTLTEPLWCSPALTLFAHFFYYRTARLLARFTAYTELVGSGRRALAREDAKCAGCVIS
jgi:hypothetical protein